MIIIPRIVRILLSVYIYIWLDGILDHQMSVDEKILSSDFNYPTQPQTTSNSNTQAYHLSVSGSILYSPPTNSPSDIFTFLRHGNFDAFRRSLDIYHNDIIRMRNDHGQVCEYIQLTKQATKFIDSIFSNF